MNAPIHSCIANILIVVPVKCSQISGFKNNFVFEMELEFFYMESIRSDFLNFEQRYKKTIKWQNTYSLPKSCPMCLSKIKLKSLAELRLYPAQLL
jgi:hypothetical protein